MRCDGCDRSGYAGILGSDQIRGSDQPGGVEEFTGKRTNAGAGYAAISGRQPGVRNDINNFARYLQ